MSKEARFRTLLTSERTPYFAGLCRLCLREMWANLKDGARNGLVAVSGDGRTCETCVRYLREQDGADPRESKGSPAERIPAERDEDQWWHQFALCRGIGVEPFAPDPMPGEKGPRGVGTTRRYIAAFLCGDCPVARECRTAALEHGYEGIWGGRFFHRNTWLDLFTDLRGPTIHASAPQRRKLLAKLAEAGYDEFGEPLDEEVVA